MAVRRALTAPLLGALALLAALVAPAPLSAATSPIPSRMAFIGDSRQVIVVTAPRIGSRNGTLRFYSLVGGAWKCLLTTRAKLGSRGLVDGTLRVEGSRTTPTGIWVMPGYVFGSHSKSPVRTRMKYRRITRRSYWSAARMSLYNTWVETSTPVPGEHLYGIRCYEYGLSTGYNAAPNEQVVGRGTAIFLHLNHSGYTAGCVSVSKAAMRRVFRLLDPKQHPRFAIGTTSLDTTTSILSY